MKNSDRRSLSDFRLSLAECAEVFESFGRAWAESESRLRADLDRLREALSSPSFRAEMARRDRLERLYGIEVRVVPAPVGFGVVRYWWRRLCGQEF